MWPTTHWPPQVWHVYTKVLYGIPEEPPLPNPDMSCSFESAFFTPQNVGAPFIYACDTLIPLSAHPMSLRNFRTIRIVHYLAKLYRLILELDWVYGQWQWPPFSWRGRLLKRVHNFGSHIHPSKPLFMREEPIEENTLLLCGSQKSLVLLCARIM